MQLLASRLRRSPLGGLRALHLGTSGFRRSATLQACAQAAQDMGKKGARAPAAAQRTHYVCNIQILNADNATASPSILLALDADRYLFNVGEGLQRLASEHRAAGIRLARVKAVLATRAATDTLGGLPGLLLTLAPKPELAGSAAAALLEAEPLRMRLVGPPGARAYAEAFRSYAGNNIELAVTEAAMAAAGTAATGAAEAGAAAGGATAAAAAAEAAPVIEDGAFAIRAILVAPAAAAQGDAGGEPAAKRPRFDSGDGGGDGNGHAALAEAAAAAAAAAGTGASDPAVCYAIELPGAPGKFDPARAKALGVPPGPLFGELQRGGTVTTPAGAVVRPEQVMGAAVPGPLLLVIDCPTAAHAEALRASPQLAAVLARHGVGGSGSGSGSGGTGNGGSGGSGGADADLRMVAAAHLTPPEVRATPAYEALVASLGAGARHLGAWAGGQRAATCRAAAALQARLNALEPAVFPLGAIAASAAAADEQAAGSKSAGEAAGADSILDANAPAAFDAPHLTRLTLMPARQRGFTADLVPPPQDLAALRRAATEAHPRVAALLREFAAARGALLAALGSDNSSGNDGGAPASAATKARAAEMAAEVPPALRGIARDVFEVVLLGTVSSVPTPARNVAGYYLDFFSRGGALADCGEDTMGQLERRYGRADALRRILELRFVWVSHMHADHHGGLYPLLARRAAAGAPPLLVVGPFPLFRVLTAYAKAVHIPFVFLSSGSFPDIKQREEQMAAAAAAAGGAAAAAAAVADAQAARKLPPAPALAALAAAKQALGLDGLEAFPVKHVFPATGLRLQGRGAGGAPWSVVLSGDTRPCDAVAEAARGAALLVHEATFEDELAADAVAKRHSTLSEALSVARASGAYRALLTHFSGRYPKLPPLAPAAEGGAGAGVGGAAAGGAAAEANGGANGSTSGETPLTAMVGRSVAVGFDFMSVNLADLPWLPLVVPACDELLREEGFMAEDDGGGDNEGGGGGAGGD